MHKDTITMVLWDETLKKLEEDMSLIASYMDNIDDIDKLAVDEHFGEPGYETIACDIISNFDKICFTAAEMKKVLRSFVLMKRMLDNKES